MKHNKKHPANMESYIGSVTQKRIEIPQHCDFKKKGLNLVQPTMESLSGKCAAEVIKKAWKKQSREGEGG